ncbi:MAG: type III toxin-antitoxin system ToxN/AbiQ family toxin [Clostridium sp.]|nr:type III toxin-antitoxin system ToxN/AbiQ family toxin [Clostridium sp.]
MGTIKAVNPTVSGNNQNGFPAVKMETNAHIFYGKVHQTYLRLRNVQPYFIQEINRNNMKQEKLQLYTMDMKYIRDLHKADNRVQSVSPQLYKNNRPFVGVVVICNKHKYCIPLDHPKEKHYSMKNDIDFSRIYANDKLIGILNFNNMIPVDETLIKRLNIKISPNDSPSEKAYKILCSKELDWIQKNKDIIIKKANKLYNMICSNKANYNLRKRCLDFKKLETILQKRQISFPFTHN